MGHYTNLMEENEGPDPEIRQSPPQPYTNPEPSKPPVAGQEQSSILVTLRRVLTQADLQKNRQQLLVTGVLLAFGLIVIAIVCLNRGPEFVPGPLQQIFGETTSTTAPPLPPVLLHKEEEYEYYKVPVARGTRLTEGKVAETCDSVGMKAICSGPSSCKYSDTSKCIITPLSTNCNNPMYPLSKVICSGSKPRNCPQFEGVFSYMKNWYGGECGRVGSDWCANGDDFVAGTTEASPGQEEQLPEAETFYGYCAKIIL